MKEIVERLHENKQIELAKSILENAGYTVTKKVTEDTQSSGAPEKYKGYRLTQYPMRDNRYQVSKISPYDDTDYYYAYSYDKENWVVCYEGKRKQEFTGTFEQIVDKLEEFNSKLSARILHN